MSVFSPRPKTRWARFLNWLRGTRCPVCAKVRRSVQVRAYRVLVQHDRPAVLRMGAVEIATLRSCQTCFDDQCLGGPHVN